MLTRFESWWGSFLVFLPAASKAFELGFLRNRSHLGRGVINGGYTSAGQHPAAPIRQDGHAASDDGEMIMPRAKCPLWAKVTITMPVRMDGTA